MKSKYWLFLRNGVYYLQDSTTRQKESLETRDRREAERLRDARNQVAENPAFGFAMAKAYLSAHDPKMAERTWQDAINEFCSRGKPRTQQERRGKAKGKPLDLIRDKRLLQTTAEDLLAVIRKGRVANLHFLRCVHNLAVGLGWLPWQILAPRLWPTIPSRPKRGITAEEHARIVAAEHNSETRKFYEFVWETGASQMDAALITAENIDWQNKVLSYQRHKTGEWAYLRIGSRMEALLGELPAKGMLFPRIGLTRSKDRAAEFRRRCRLLKISGISLHSYRYAWAERAKECGYPERFAQQALGHGSKAVHRAYARGANAIVPPLETYENQAQRKVIPLPASPAPAQDLPIAAAGQ